VKKLTTETQRHREELRKEISRKRNLKLDRVQNKRLNEPNANAFAARSSSSLCLCASVPLCLCGESSLRLIRLGYQRSPRQGSSVTVDIPTNSKSARCRYRLVEAHQGLPSVPGTSCRKIQTDDSYRTSKTRLWPRPGPKHPVLRQGWPELATSLPRSHKQEGSTNAVRRVEFGRFPQFASLIPGDKTGPCSIGA
jgi:hypothetical protein